MRLSTQVTQALWECQERYITHPNSRYELDGWVTYQDFLNPLSGSLSQEELRQTGRATAWQVTLDVYTDELNKTIFNGK